MSRKRSAGVRLCAALPALALAANAWGASALFGNIQAKSGIQNARVWTVVVGNSGPDTAVGARINAFSLTQVAGAACTPVVTPPSAFPVQLNDLPPGTSQAAFFTIDFTGCATAARFTASIAASADSGAATVTVVRYNQFR